MPDVSFVAGAPVPRVEDDRLLTGEGRFLNNRKFTNLVHAVVVRSVHPHARIKEVKITRVELVLIAVSIALLIFSPTAEPRLPPINEKSIIAITISAAFILPIRVFTASLLPVFSCAS